ncbi:hypothetical protein BDV59DRAFT_199761 [Aspergillus ambiguus]|uniref:uncharacterized protein n=1 Tax=Aspergillus ambiguus TaxID=176160 RepID=UPI003CCDFFC3
MAEDEPTKQARAVLGRFNTALSHDDAHALESCFVPTQAYWKDQLALTYHLRTFISPRFVAAALLETKTLRGIEGEFAIDGFAYLVPLIPTLQFINCEIVFRTVSPGATCRGTMALLPVKSVYEDNKETIEWKIWILSTRLDNLDLHPENEMLLKTPGRQMGHLEQFETDVFILGGGNAAIALAARLKALGVQSVMAERNPNAGDNWALRYDSMRFHIPTSACDLPYMPYAKELRHRFLSKDELAAQVRRYVEAFNLDMITSSQIQSTQYDPSAQRWEIGFRTPTGQHTAISKHLVIASGFGSQKIMVPSIPGRQLYQGISIHSQEFQNGDRLKEQGIKSVLVIGSANTAFDVLEDCHAAGLTTTMVIRSPTYLLPADYVCDKSSLGVYDMGVEDADTRLMALPTYVDGNLARNRLANFAEKEPDRYKKLAAAGFPVLDSRHPDMALTHNLLERAGGHYIDVGGTKLIEEGKANVKAGAEPIAYTSTGLQFSDGSSICADAVIWCTGFADKDVRASAVQILGGEASSSGEEIQKENLLGPSDIAARLDATWGIDSEGEVRGMWKRHLRLDNIWTMGGFTQQHRWHSRTLALQIKAALEEILPPAYRDTPLPASK